MKYYRYFKKQDEFYSYLNLLLEEGYVIKKHYFLTYLLEKDNDSVLLSPFKIKDLNNYEQELEQYNHKYVISKPNYDDTNLNLIAGIRRNFGFNYKLEVDDKIFDKKYDHIVLLLLDGLGLNVLNNDLPDDSFLRRHYFKSVNSIFPSTTACATTSIISGLPPIANCWTGWHNYFKEIDKDIILFRGINYYDKNDTNNPTAYELIPYKPFFSDMGIGGMVFPNFNKPKFKDVLKRSLESINEDKVQYVYFTDPDETMHIKGTYSKKAKRVLKKLDRQVCDYANKLPDNTLLLVIADHGHIPVYKELTLYDNQELMNMLLTKPSNDTRCIVFRVKDEYKDIFKDKFKMYYEDIYDIYDTDYLIDEGFFGKKEESNPRIKEFLGDLIAIAKSDYLLQSKKDHPFKSHHAGYTKEEMIVPVIVYKK